MNRRRFLAIAGLSAGVPLWAGGAEVEASDLLERASDLSRVSGSQAEVDIENIDSAGRVRKRRLTTMTKRAPGSREVMRLARFIDPPDLRGTATLIHENADRDDDIWLYLPNTRKVRRILTGGRKDRFLGTEFTYGDVVGFKRHEWRDRLTGESDRPGAPCIVVSSEPTNADVAGAYGYSKRVTFIRKADRYPVEIDLYDPDGVLAKSIVASEVTSVGEGKWQAMRFVATHRLERRQSVLAIRDYRVVAGISGDLFRPDRLEER